jgi:D-alanyl-D-alanine carboxypeptidase (penicillin-binding protein 5/6)
MRFLSALVLSFALTSAALAQAPQPPEVAARSYLVLDLTTGQTLAERNADQPIEPASLTKLMTAYLVFGALKEKRLTLEQTLPVSRRAWEQRKGGGSLMFIDTTMTPKVDELLKGLIVQSGNDAAVALAEGVGGTVEQFVAMMNRQGAAFGLKQTTFKNPTGLTEPGHTTTAREIATVATRIVQDFPEYYPYYALQEYRYNNITQPNRNLLLRRDPTVDGMKTGFTDNAGYCLLATAERPYPNLTPAGAPAGTTGKRRVLTVVMHTASMEARAAESQRLLNWGFQAFDTMRLLDAGKPVATVQVWKGVAPEAKLGPARSVLVSVPKGEGGKLKTRVERSDPLVAPLAKDQAVGRIVVTTAADQPVAEVPLVVLEPVEQAGLLGRAWDALRLWIK